MILIKKLEKGENYEKIDDLYIVSRNDDAF